MNKLALFLSLVSLAAPVHAQSTARHSDSALVVMANERAFCGALQTAIAARYRSDTDDTVEVTCSEDAEGFVPLAAAAGLGLGGAAAGAAAIAGIGVAAVAAGGGGSTPDTQ